MSSSKIILDFGSFTLEAKLFDKDISRKLADNLPYKIQLQKWGEEVYGSIGIDLGEDSPVAKIPCGGIAYTNNGNYLCIFFGQTPAWPVEYIGQINDDGWQKLLTQPTFSSVEIIKK